MKFLLIPFLKSLAVFSRWSEIIQTVSSVEVDYYASFASLTPITMDEDVFWQLIEESKRHSSSVEEQDEILISELSKRSPDDIAEFAVIFNRKMQESYRWDLWAIGYIINNGCSDDGFTEFRAWLICQGREFYNHALVRPEFIGDQASAEFAGLLWACYGFDLTAPSVYEEKTGYELRVNYSQPPFTPMGDRWAEDDLPVLYPSLCEKFGMTT